MSFYGDLKTPLDTNTQAAVDKVIDKFLFIVSSKQLALTQFYWTKKPTVHYMGSSQSRFGTFIGLPVHFRYKHPSEVDLSTIESKGLSKEENSELLQRLRESLVLSEEAKKFAISSEFFSAHSPHLIVKANGILMAAGAYFTVKHLFLQYFEAASPAAVFSILIGVALVWTVAHFWVSGVYYKNLRASSDRKTAQLGEDFLQGGLEYLKKTLEKNKVLRELDPSTATLMFKSNGDEIQGVLDIRAMSISERLNHLQKIEEKKQQMNDSSKVTLETSD
ncbi:transmembrane protein 177-like isoform X2 [Mercenaria mercenaria]|nr:transmembrane protein 177-like isoform X2 [Mercenaria mercenaria]